jgi:hypothetical protein
VLLWLPVDSIRARKHSRALIFLSAGINLSSHKHKQPCQHSFSQVSSLCSKLAGPAGLVAAGHGRPPCRRQCCALTQSWSSHMPRVHPSVLLR